MIKLVPRTLQEFCSTVPAGGVSSEVDRAWKFRVSFGIGFPVSVNDLYSILQASGISLHRPSRLPSEVDGFHHSYDGTTEIVLNGTSNGDREIRALLHEIRGVMSILETGSSERDDLSGATHQAADMFAACVMMPPEVVIVMLMAAVWDGVRSLPAAAQWALLAGVGLMVYVALRRIANAPASAE